MSRRRRIVARAAIGLALAGLVTWGWVNRARYSPVDTGATAPNITATTLAGETVELDAYRGRVVLLNVWATWCTPCRWEMPAIERLHRELRDEGLAVVAVSVDAPPGQLDALARAGGDVAGFVRELGLTFDVLLDPEGNIMRRYGIGGLPTTYLIDRDGTVREKVIGPAAWDDDRHVAAVRDLLKG